MTIEELKILAKQGEGYTLEFKENLGKKFAAEVVAFAISEESGCITGEIFPCNKGNHLRTDYN